MHRAQGGEKWGFDLDSDGDELAIGSVAGFAYILDVPELVEDDFETGNTGAWSNVLP